MSCSKSATSSGVRVRRVWLMAWRMSSVISVKITHPPHHHRNSVTPVAIGTEACSRDGFFRVLLRVSACVEEPRLVCEDDGLDTVAEAELLKNVRDVRLDGRLADVELSTDL